MSGVLAPGDGVGVAPAAWLDGVGVLAPDAGRVATPADTVVSTGGDGAVVSSSR